MPKTKKTYAIGIDVGGTKMRAVLFDGAKVIADYELATPLDNVKHFMIMMNALVEPLREHAQKMRVRIKGIGIGMAGVIDPVSRKITAPSPNIPMLKGAAVADRLEEMAGLPVAMENDVDSFIRAEVTLGAAKDYDDVYGIIIGTGIGGSWWVNNGIYRGSHGGAGEPGRFVVDLSSGMDLEQTYHKLSQNNAGQLARKAYLGDPLAERTFAEIGRYLGAALANITNIIDPKAFVIGGGVARSHDLFLSHAKKFMKQYIESPESARKVKVFKSKLGEDAGAIGAALLVG